MNCLGMCMAEQKCNPISKAPEEIKLIFQNIYPMGLWKMSKRMDVILVSCYIFGCWIAKRLNSISLSVSSIFGKLWSSSIKPWSLLKYVQGFLGPKTLFVNVCTYQAQINYHELLRSMYGWEEVEPYIQGPIRNKTNFP